MTEEIKSPAQIAYDLVKEMLADGDSDQANYIEPVSMTDWRMVYLVNKIAKALQIERDRKLFLPDEKSAHPWDDSDNRGFNDCLKRVKEMNGVE